MSIGVYFVSVFVFLGFFAQGEQLSPSEIYGRCFSKLSNHPVDIDSTEFNEVVSGRLDPVEACAQLLERATFVSVNGGQRSRLQDVEDPVLVSTLNNFQQFHESWFGARGERTDTFSIVFGMFRDYSESALYLTDSLFGEKHYRDVFRRQDSIRGVRHGENLGLNYILGNTGLTTTLPFIGPIIGGESDLSMENIYTIPTNDVTSTGYLLGIEPTPSVQIPIRRNQVTNPMPEDRYTSTNFEKTGFDVSEHFGGGILGSTYYILTNSEANGRLDGGNRIHRRLANNTFYDLMCLSLPNLLPSDIGAYMERYKDSSISFRRDTSCAQCHASLDPFAHAFRNIATVQSASNNFGNAFRQKFGNQNRFYRFMTDYAPKVSEDSSLDSDNLYHRRTPRGQLYYRNYTGDLVNIPVVGIQELGEAISQQMDPYVCAAQRYYQFLTGIDVPVSSQENTEFVTTHKNEIIRIGTQLKEHGSLKKMIVEILRTEAFQATNPGLENQGEGN